MFTGYYLDPETPGILIKDYIVWITVDIPVDIEAKEVELYLSDLKEKIQTDLYKEKEIWVTCSQIYRIV